MISCHRQVRQLKAEARTLEEAAAALHKDVHAAESTIAKSTIKQQSLQLQKTMAQLEREKAEAVQEQQQLMDPHASLSTLQVGSAAHSASSTQTRVSDKYFHAIHKLAQAIRVAEHVT